MKILIACEKSQEICKAFRQIGHEAFSCDIDSCTGGHPEWHIQDDVLMYIDSGEWDMMIGHPPCTYLTVSNTYMNRGCSKYTADEAKELRHDAIMFFFALIECEIPIICIENPIGIMSKIYGKPNQIIQPYEFGHPESKATCLWLKGLPLLKPTKWAEFTKYRCKCGNVFDAKYGKYGCCDGAAKPLWDNQTKSGQNKLPPSAKRAELRAKTYPGIAQAMAEQWGKFIESGLSLNEYEGKLF